MRQNESSTSATEHEKANGSPSEIARRPSVRVQIDGEEITFVIRGNNCMFKERCPICGVVDRADAPYAIIAFPCGADEKNYGWVCHSCARKHVPLLLEAKEALVRVERQGCSASDDEAIKGSIKALEQWILKQSERLPRRDYRLGVFLLEDLKEYFEPPELPF